MTMQSKHINGGALPPINLPITEKACREAEELLPAYSVGATDPEETRFVEAMLDLCPELAISLGEYASLSRSLLDIVPETQAPPAVDKIMAHVLAQEVQDAMVADAVPEQEAYQRYEEIRHLFGRSVNTEQRPSEGEPLPFQHEVTTAVSDDKIIQMPMPRQPHRWVMPAALVAVVALFVLINFYWLVEFQTLQQNQQSLAALLNQQSQQEDALNSLLEAQGTDDETILQLIASQQINQEQLITLLEQQESSEAHLREMITILQTNQDTLAQALAEQQTSQTELVQLITEQLVNQETAFTVGAAQQHHRQLLAAQPGQSSAQANFIWDTESKIGSLVATGLSVLPSGNVYQLWLVRGDQEISLGSFQVDENGTGVLIFQSPEPIEAFDLIGISVENESESPEPTTPHVVIGEI